VAREGVRSGDRVGTLISIYCMLILVGDRLLGVIFCEKGGYGTTWYEKDKSNYQKNVLLYHSQTYKVAEYLLSIPIYTCFEITCTKVRFRGHRLNV